MPKGMEGYESQEKGYSKYDPSNSPVTKNGGNDKKHDGIVSTGEKYPKPNASGKGMTE